MKKHYWKQSNGDKILISNMTTSHLKNAINYIINSRITDRYEGHHINSWVQILESELNNRENKLKNNNKLYKIY